ncbi:MAG TPA: adenosylcobalamin-dependent ribonucleoside-diphosphate reductase [Candidatus Paceibacterota bacterium]|nr:adenosylcobalamin-dependent ribonucleoside-diphosphate reductase [Candidatus Paceibacterota bacterium]
MENNEKQNVNKEGKNIYTYDEAFEKSKEYFEGDEFAAKVFLDKYILRDNEDNILENSPPDMFHRIATELARIEKNKFKEPMSYEEIYSYIDGFKKIIPQGSPLYGIGNKYQYISLSNCFVCSSPLDSYASICKTDEEIVNISKRRGGVGFDISNLRPKGTSTSNAAKSSTGIIPFCERYSNTIREVGQNSRRGALILTLSIHHPEIINFVTAKKDLTKITGANISVKLTDEFLKAVERNESYEQRWPVDSKNPVTYKLVDAKEIWNTIIKSAWAVGEPGLLMWDNIIKESPADCYSDFGFKSTSVNPCSELVLSNGDSCRLLLLNLYTYVKNPFTKKSYFDFEEFYKDAQIAQRFMDDIVDLEIEHIDRIIKKVKNDPEPIEIKKDELSLWERIRKSCLKGRRTGTGITALGDTLAALGIKYGSNKSIETAEEIYKTLKLGCYRSSVDMAKELGPFEIWNHDLEKNNNFLLRIKENDKKLWNDMKKYGRRNIGILTSSPSGSVSILAKTSSGIEPVFQLSYKRRKKINPNDKNVRIDFKDQNGDCWQEFEIYHPKLKEWIKITGETDITKSPWYGCCAEEINWKNRVELQARANKHVDHSISSTVNLPEDVKVEEVAKIYETAWKSGCKGITVYRKNSRSGVLIDTKDNKPHILYTTSPKRPKSLPCDIYHVSVKGEEYFVIIGFLNGNEPYEVFAGKNSNISKNLKKAQIRKAKRGQYELCDIIDEKIILHDNISQYIDEEQEAITRLLSAGLRHGCSIDFIVHSLEKTRGDLMGFAKAICRILKKYVKDGATVKGEECPECGSKLFRIEGCISCQSCGWTKC